MCTVDLTRANRLTRRAVLKQGAIIAGSLPMVDGLWYAGTRTKPAAGLPSTPFFTTPAHASHHGMFVCAVDSARAAASFATLQPYVDPLPIPARARPVGTQGGVPCYEVAMSQFTHRFHRDLAPTTVWGYNGQIPGPTFDVLAGSTVKVRWINNLPAAHLLEINPNIHGAEPPTPPVRTVVHLHGGHTPPEFDGFPESWFVPGQSALCTYPNNRRGTLLWYHDHSLGITRLNVYAGLAGAYVIRDLDEDDLNLPKGQHEIPLIIQDKIFNDDGSLFYPAPSWPPNPEFFGTTAVVNGKAWPYLTVKPRKYRFRILNASNSRFYNFKLSSGQTFQQIGTDGGLMAAPVTVSALLLAPAERADVIVDFSHAAGATITLTNDAPAPFPGGGEADIPEIMQFRVTAAPVRDDSVVPARLEGAAPRLYPGKEDQRPLTAAASRTRDITLREFEDANGNPLRLLLNDMHWDAPVTEKPKLGSTEIWRLINLTGDAHPMHIHLVQFRILDRQPFDEDKYDATGKVVFTGPRRPPDPNEMGWKDTVRTLPGEVTRVIMRFDGYKGRYVYHCHILEHEENDMMRPFDVV